MKQLFFMLMVMMTMFSCTENEIIIKYVPCTFNSSAFIGDIVETRAGDNRMITCHFPTALGEKTFTKNVNERFTVELPAGETATAYFVYAENQSPTIHNTINVTSSKKETYNAIWTGVPVYGKLYQVKLTRSVAQYTGKTGNIPAGYSLKIYAKGAKQFDWLDPTSINTDRDSHLVSNASLPFTSYIVGGDNNIIVTLQLLNANNQKVKEGIFTYSIPANVHRTVTYNASNHTDGGFEVSISDEEMTIENTEDNIN